MIKIFHDIAVNVKKCLHCMFYLSRDLFFFCAIAIVAGNLVIDCIYRSICTFYKLLQYIKLGIVAS